ncbi:MAG: DNA starvation/stationary phase protection protein Dps [Anaerolineae bacterium]|nr:DNA starvation/stationary phase protection protein Dps [Anaerolineae bacterium]MDW8171299.1 DNA starvation/stationary phase protection protein Dps [Anaerolineae bacterium]
MSSTTRARTTRINLDPTVRDQMAALLNQQLANAFDLYSQAKQAHWNVKGMHFIALHKLFDEIAEEVLESVDDLAERVTALGAEALGTARMAAQNSALAEFPSDLSSGEAFVEALAERLAAYANGTRRAADVAAEAGDQITNDLLVTITREMDKLLYFLEAHLQ